MLINRLWCLFRLGASCSGLFNSEAPDMGLVSNVGSLVPVSEGYSHNSAIEHNPSDIEDVQKESHQADSPLNKYYDSIVSEGHPLRKLAGSKKRVHQQVALNGSRRLEADANAVSEYSETELLMGNVRYRTIVPSPEERAKKLQNSLDNLKNSPHLESCLTPAEEVQSPLQLNRQSISISRNAIVANNYLIIAADIMVKDDAAVEPNRYHLTVDAGRLGSFAGVNYDDDLCKGLLKFNSNVTCPVSPGHYESVVLVKKFVPYIPGLGTWIRSVFITFAVYETADGHFDGKRSAKVVCLEGTIPILSS